jgi:hypothetical protein
VEPADAIGGSGDLPVVVDAEGFNVEVFDVFGGLPVGVDVGLVFGGHVAEGLAAVDAFGEGVQGGSDVGGRPGFRCLGGFLGDLAELLLICGFGGGGGEAA